MHGGHSYAAVAALLIVVRLWRIVNRSRISFEIVANTTRCYICLAY